MAFNQYVTWCMWLCLHVEPENNTTKQLKAFQVTVPWRFLAQSKASQAFPQVITIKQSQKSVILASVTPQFGCLTSCLLVEFCQGY